MAAPPAYDDSGATQLAVAQDFPLDVSQPHSCALSWDFAGGQAIDIDVQAVIVDANGTIVDAAYYNNMKACGRAITHSGDETDGKTPGIDEKVTLHLQRLTQTSTQLVIIVVACYSGGQFSQVAKGEFKVLNEGAHTTVAGFNLDTQSCGNATANIACVVYRTASGWSLRPIKDTSHNGRHFMDILQGLSTHIRTFIPRAPPQQKVNFQMQKGDVVEFGSNMSYVECGLGWDTSMGKVDLDVSCVLFDNSGNFLEAVFFGNLRSQANHSQQGAVCHSGDDTTGDDGGDDETMKIFLDKLGPSVAQIFFCVCVYSVGRTFANVAKPYCRCVDSNRQELCMYRLDEAGNSNALLIARVAKDPRTSRWGFHALGLPAAGRMYKDCLPDMNRIFFQKTSNFANPNASAAPQMQAAQYAAPPVAPPAAAPQGQQQIVINMQAPPTPAPQPVQPTQKSNDSCCVVM